MKSLRLLFPETPKSPKTSCILLASRLFFGLTFAGHGLDKLNHFAETAAHFPAPFGMSGDAAVALTIFGELVCGVAFALGFLTLLPMILTMLVAFATVHGGSVNAGEPAFLYLVVFLLSWFAGAGKYSFDGFVADRMKPVN